MVEHGTENAGVDSSSLSLGTTPSLIRNHKSVIEKGPPGVSLTNARRPLSFLILNY